MNITIGLNAETLTALNALTAAISGIGSFAPAPAAAQVTSGPAEKAEAKAEKKEEAKADSTAKTTTATEPTGPIYWFSSASGEVGLVQTEDEFKALKKADPKTVKTTETKYNEKIAAKAAAAAKAAETSDEDDTPSEQDVIDAFSAYLPVDLDKEERAVRVAFVKPLLQRFGAKKATELAEAHRKLAINLVQRKMAGEDIDPESADFAEVAAEAEDDLV